MIPEFSRIRLTTDRYLHEGVGKGAIGFNLDVIDGGYIVEFSRPDGATIAWFGVEPEEIEPALEAVVSAPDRLLI